MNSHLNLLFWGFLFLMIFTSCKDNSVSIQEEEFKLPTVFNGLEADVVFQADTVITRYDRQTNQRVFYPYPNQQFTTRNLVISQNNQFAYFLDQSLVIGSMGTLVRLDLLTEQFEVVTDRQFDSFGILDDTWVVFTNTETQCPGTPLAFRVYSFLNLTTQQSYNLCDAFPAFSELTGLDATPLYSLANLRIEQNRLYGRLAWNDESAEPKPRIVMDVLFNFEANTIEPVSAEINFTTVASGSISPSGRYILQHRNDNSLWLVDRIASTETQITQTFTNPSPTFLLNETKIAFILTRPGVSFDNPSRGLFLYDINSELLIELLPEATVIEQFHFSPSGNQVVVTARFDEIGAPRTQIVALSVNGSQAALISNPFKSNSRPKFVP